MYSYIWTGPFPMRRYLKAFVITKVKGLIPINMSFYFEFDHLY